MRITSTLTVPASQETVFEHFLDPVTLKACIPGCEELAQVDERHYRGRLVNEIAHVRFNASFAVEITELASPSLVRAVLTGEDRRLGSSLRLNAALSVEAAGDESKVTYEMEMALWGKLGRLGESIVRRRTVEVEKQFALAFSDACTRPVGEPPAESASPADQQLANRSGSDRAGTQTMLGGSGSSAPPATGTAIGAGRQQRIRQPWEVALRRWAADLLVRLAGRIR